MDRVATVQSPLDQPNTKGGLRSLLDPGAYNASAWYRVVAQNTVGDTADYSNPGNEIAPGSYAFPGREAGSRSQTR